MCFNSQKLGESMIEIKGKYKPAKGITDNAEGDAIAQVIELCNQKKDQKIRCNVFKTRRKTIGIIIDRNGEVRVHVPYYVREMQVLEVWQKKADWIVKRVNEITEKNSNSACRQYISGDKFLYLGKEYTLDILDKVSGEDEVFVQKDTISVYISHGLPEEGKKQAVKEALIKWYRQRFTEFVRERVEKYSIQLNAAPCKVVIKNQKTLWGSCSQKGNINLNWRLMMAPVDIIDYVVVHELCHLKVMNHSKDFWNLAASILPNYQESRKWLKVNGHRLSI